MMMLELMQGLRVYHLRFTIQARELMVFGPQPGAQLRGALYDALSRHFCSEPGFERTPDHHTRCPACWLLAIENPDNPRGRDLPRPLTVEPPLDVAHVPAGEAATFGLTLVGQQARALFPYLVRAIETMGRTGVGRGRGRFTVQAIEAVHPLRCEQVSLLSERTVSHAPDMPVTAMDIQQETDNLPTNRVSLRFLTPLRIGEAKHVAHYPALGILLRRLIERCQAMVEHYGDQAVAVDRERWKATQERLGGAGDTATLVRDSTRWLDVQSGSRRRGAPSPIGGLVGMASWQGKLDEAIPWLLWGERLHVGKSATKGNGWYQVERE